MPRKKSTQPAYQFHISGQAKVRLDYTDFYLGPHGSPESYARYYALLAEYNANGQKAPVRQETPEESVRMADSPILVRQVVEDYRHRELPNMSLRNRQCLGLLCDLLVDRYGDIEVNEFGPRRLEHLRDILLTKGLGKKGKPNCRRQANDHTSSIVRMIEHGVCREMVPPERIVALRSLKPLRPGQAKDNPPRKPVPLQVVAATMPNLPASLQAVVRIQLATAARPGEILKMRPMDIDRSGQVWFYRPQKHKTTHHGKVRAIPLVEDAVAALAPFLEGPADQFCFLTSKGTPWNKDSYARAVTRAAVKANVEHWSPYQLRRTSGQAIRDAVGAEQLQALYGHSSISMVDHYTKVNELKAIEAAKCAPRIV